MLARGGAHVALVARDEASLDRVAGEIGNAAFAVRCDVTDESSVLHMARKVESALGGVPDIIVNNAGVFRVARLDAMPTGLFTDVIGTNLVGPFLVLRAFIEELRRRGSGHIVTIGSIADRAIFPENGAYAPAKHALRALHEVLREELRGSGVRATLISPGSVDTAMWDDVTFEGESRTAPTRGVMLRPDDVAAAVLYALTQPQAVNVDELRLSHS